MSGSQHLGDRVAALETTVAALETEIATMQRQHQEDDARIADMQRQLTDDAQQLAELGQQLGGAHQQLGQVQQQLAELQQRVPAARTGEAPALQDTASDLAALDAWLIAQTGVSLEYQLQRMCAQFYGNPLMPPS